MNDLGSAATKVAKRPAPSRLATLTVLEGIRAIEAGDLTCEAWAKACLERIDERNAEVKAWVHVDADKAIRRARAIDQRGRQGVFDGVPLGVKDTIDTADMPTELGDPEMFSGRRPELDAPVVMMARQRGVNILGKNTVSRHAIMLPGPCRNPHDITRTPAASSAGSAAAVADFMTPLSIGTQTAGSILRPASFCGAVGFKPTLDAIPYFGIRTYSRPLDVVGPLCRSVDDAVLFMREFMSDPRYSVQTEVRTDLTVGVWRTENWEDSEACIKTVFEDNLCSLAKAGAKVVELEMPRAFDGIGEAQDVIMAYDLAREYAAVRRDHSDKCDPELLAYLDKGSTYSDRDYAAALDLADACRRMFYESARGIDTLAMPATLGEAPLATSTGSSAFIRIWSLLHNPAISLPVARGPNGLPIALQLVGFVKEDARFLYHARCVERIVGNVAAQA